MLNLLNYIAQGNDVHETVTLHTDKESLIKFKRLENQINDTINSDKVAELELEKSELRQKIVDGAVHVSLALPSRDSRAATIAKMEAETKLDPDSPEYLTEGTVWLLADAIQKITTPESEDEAPFSPDDIRAFRDHLAPIPTNWRKLVDAYDVMVNEDILLDSHNTSPDFS